MKFVLRCLTINLTCLMMMAGCATYNAQKVGPTPILEAEAEIPEEQLLDVGILVFDSQELTEKQAKKEGTNPDIRKAESHYIPYHLKNTLQQSSQWGAVRVVPSETQSMDLMVKGQIIESNGEHLVLKIDVSDATGKRWLSKTYEEEATDSSYSGNRPAEKDAYQGMYNTIANDIAELKLQLGADEIHKIRTTSKLRFAKDFAPDAFGNYLKEDQDGILQLNRLPADDDPMMERLLKIREREYMYVDTLNEYYQIFYSEMWGSYENWRALNLTEQLAIRKIKRDALIRQIIGALLLAGAIALEAGDVDNVGALQVGMVIVGGQVIIEGFNISRQAEIHAAAIEELSESFGNEMQPVVMDFQGKKYELTGSAEEQFKRWRELLRKIYLTETGFDPNLPAAGEAGEEQVGP
jgi:hypothetical protein